LFSVEPPQELSKGFCSGVLGALFRPMPAAAQSHRQWLVVAINLPAPLPRTGVRMLHDDMIFGDGIHVTPNEWSAPHLARGPTARCSAGIRGRPNHLHWDVAVAAARLSANVRRIHHHFTRQTAADRGLPRRPTAREPNVNDATVTKIVPNSAAPLPSIRPYVAVSLVKP
jgi:hypothetical protein